MNTNTTSAVIPDTINMGELLNKAGSNLADPRIVFEGDVFDGTQAYARNPLESEAAYSKALRSTFEITDVTEHMAGFTYDEVAVALHAVLRRRPEGKPQPVSNDPTVTPGTRRVPIGYDWDTGEMNYLTVPKGEMSMPGFRNSGAPNWQPTMQVRNISGNVYLVANVVRGDQDFVQGIFGYVREWANTHSIYLGQVFNQNFEFLKMTDFKLENVAFTDPLRNAVDLFVRGPLMYSDANKREGIPPKSGLFLQGPPGGGKTMIKSACAYIGARSGAAVCDVHPEAGISGFEQANERTLRLMKHGHKVMLLMEDMEKLAVEARATVLEILDGGEAKGLKRIVVGTTNFIERIDRAMIRPGRFDGVEYCGLPDRAAFEQLLRVQLRNRDLSSIDFDAAFPSFDGYTYAFIANAVTNILRAAVIRTKGEPVEDVVTTEDLIAAAQSVRGHFDLLQTEVVKDAPVLDDLFRTIVEERIEASLVQRNFSDDVNYDHIRYLAKEAADEVVEGRLNRATIELPGEKQATIFTR